MPKGILGLPRLFSIGPLTYGTPINGTGDVEDELVEILDDMGIEDGDRLTREEFDEIVARLVQEIYPDGGKVFETPAGPVNEQQIFVRCLSSKWAELWQDGFTRATTGDVALFEELIIKANGCAGIAGAGTSGIRVLLSTD